MVSFRVWIHTLTGWRGICNAARVGQVGFCTALTRKHGSGQGLRCTRETKSPTGLCVLHQKTEFKEQQVIKHKYAVLGRSLKVTPINALLSLIYEAAGNVQYYRERVGEQERLVLAGKKEREEISKIVVLYNEERDRLQRYTNDALRIGVEAKQVKLYEVQAKAFVQMAKSIVQELDLRGEQRERALKIAAEQLRLFTQQSNEGNAWKGPFLDGSVKEVVEVTA